MHNVHRETQRLLETQMDLKKFLDRRKADEDAKRKEADRKRNELQKMRAESRESQKIVS